MFSFKQDPVPPTTPEPNGIEIKIRLSQEMVAKLLSLLLTLFFGSGFLLHNQSVEPSSITPENNDVEMLGQDTADHSNTNP